MSSKLPPDQNGSEKKQNPLETPLLASNTYPQFDFSDEKMLEEENFEDVYRKYPLTDDTMCGFGSFRGGLLQK